MLEIIKVSRATPAFGGERPPSFPPLSDLRLEMLEVSKKLKPGLPLIPFTDPKPPPTVELVVERPTKKDTETKPKKKDRSERPVERPPLEEDLLAEETANGMSGSDPAEDLGVEDHVVEEVHDDATEGSVALSAEEEKKEEPIEVDPFAGLSPEEREKKERELYMWKFQILRMQWKGHKIPEFGEFAAVDEMKRVYDATVREISLTASVDRYKKYLFYLFMGLEYAATQWMGFNIEGFTAQQLLMMNDYEVLLVELGEKSYLSLNSNWPVEVRLLFMVVVNAAVFFVGKMVAEKSGSTAANLFRHITGQPTPAPPGSEGEKKKMRGPSLRPDDIQDKS